MRRRFRVIVGLRRWRNDRRERRSAGGYGGRSRPRPATQPDANCTTARVAHAPTIASARGDGDTAIPGTTGGCSDANATGGPGASTGATFGADGRACADWDDFVQAGDTAAGWR